MSKVSKLQGLIAVDKPIGYTSNDIVTFLRLFMAHLVKPNKYSIPNRDTDLVQIDDPSHSSKQTKPGQKKKYQHKWPQGAKAGTFIHFLYNSSILIREGLGQAGTLDPLATGVMVIGLQKGTKQLSYFLNSSKKTYVATGKFGSSTDTYDSTGSVTQVSPILSTVTEEAIRDCLKKYFTGEIMQKPPLYSALKVNGRKLCDLVRECESKGESTDHLIPQERLITIYSISLENYSCEDQTFVIRVECSSGTYIRSIVNDLGVKMGTLAHMTQLRRVSQGPFRIPEDKDFNEDTCIPLLTVDDLINYEKMDEFCNNQKYIRLINEYIESVKAEIEASKQNVEKAGQKRQREEDNEDEEQAEK